MGNKTFVIIRILDVIIMFFFFICYFCDFLGIDVIFVYQKTHDNHEILRGSVPFTLIYVDLGSHL